MPLKTLRNCINIECTLIEYSIRSAKQINQMIEIMKTPKEIFELEAEVILWCNIEVILM